MRIGRDLGGGVGTSMLTIEELEQGLTPIHNPLSLHPMWRFPWGPFLFLLQDLGPGGPYRYSLKVNTRSFRVTGGKSTNRAGLLKKVVRQVNQLSPEIFSQAANFLLDQRLPPPRGKPALERVVGGFGV